MCLPHAHADVVEGIDYKLLYPPQVTNSGKKIEVLEFFFYQCPYCYHLQGPLSDWKKTMSKDVDLQFVPVIFNNSAEPMARTFFALQLLGQSARLHKDLFEAIHELKINMSNEDTITEFVVKHGVDRKKFVEAYHSFLVQSKVENSKQMELTYGVHGTPTIVVDGKYLITELQLDETIRVLGEVVAMVRKERSKH
jgi:thiol:disulfide interchange protein DsbA